MMMPLDTPPQRHVNFLEQTQQIPDNYHNLNVFSTIFPQPKAFTTWQKIGIAANIHNKFVGPFITTPLLTIWKWIAFPRFYKIVSEKPIKPLSDNPDPLFLGGIISIFIIAFKFSWYLTVHDHEGGIFRRVKEPFLKKATILKNEFYRYGMNNLWNNTSRYVKQQERKILINSHRNPNLPPNYRQKINYDLARIRPDHSAMEKYEHSSKSPQQIYRINETRQAIRQQMLQNMRDELDKKIPTLVPNYQQYGYPDT